MFFSKGAQYAIKAVLDIASVYDEAGTTTLEVSERQKISRVFLAKIVQRLVHAGLITAHRGAGGGITLARLPSEINLRQVIEAIDGPIAVAQCLLRPGECSEEGVCPIHYVLVDLRQKTFELLENTTLADLLNCRKDLVAATASIK